MIWYEMNTVLEKLLNTFIFIPQICEVEKNIYFKVIILVHWMGFFFSSPEYCSEEVWDDVDRWLCDLESYRGEFGMGRIVERNGTVPTIISNGKYISKDGPTASTRSYKQSQHGTCIIIMLVFWSWIDWVKC